MALRAVVIRSANLLRSVSRIAASYKDFQSGLESTVSIEEIMGTQNRHIVSNEPQFLQSCSGRGNALDIQSTSDIGIFRQLTPFTEGDATSRHGFQQAVQLRLLRTILLLPRRLRDIRTRIS